MVEQHDLARPDARDLAAQLGADRAARAGDQHDCILEVAADAMQIRVHGVAAQHVLDPHVAHVPPDVDRARQQFEHGRQRAHRDAAVAARRDDAHPQLARRRGNRDDHLVGLCFVEDLWQLACRASNSHAADSKPLLERIVIDEADDIETEVGVATELLADQAPSLPGADDQHAASADVPAKSREAAIGDRAREDPRAHQEDHREQRIQDSHGRRHQRRDRDVGRVNRVLEVHRMDDRDDADEQHAVDHECAHEVLDIALADVAPAPLVDAGQREDHGAAEDNPRPCPRQQQRIRMRDLPVEAQPEREVVRERDQTSVHHELRQRMAVKREGRRAKPSAHYLDCTG